MNKFSYLIAGSTVLLLSVLSVSAYAAGPMWGQPYGESTITGQIVRNPQGDYLGTIGDVVHDSQGHISLVALNQYPTFGLGMPWRRLAVPFSALRWDGDKGYYVLNATQEKLASAPDFRNEDISNQDWVTDVYKFYGLQPSWTDMGSTGKMGNLMGGPMENHPMMDYRDEYRR